MTTCSLVFAYAQGGGSDKVLDDLISLLEKNSPTNIKLYKE